MTETPVSNYPISRVWPYILQYYTSTLTVAVVVLGGTIQATTSEVGATFVIIWQSLLALLCCKWSHAPLRWVLFALMLLDTLQAEGRVFYGHPEMVGHWAAIDNAFWMVALVYLYECPERSSASQADVT
jgi:hypothetical protein